MSKIETDVTELKINTGTYEAIQENLSQIDENELIFTTDKNTPVPTANDAGKVLKVNEDGEYELGEGGSGSSHPYISLERLDNYAYAVTFNTIPEDTNMDLSVGGGCSSYVANGFLYRNLDWTYSENASFYIKCKDFEGMSFTNGLTDSNLDDTLIGQLPYHIVDGRNNSGIRIATHVLYNDWSWQGSGDVPLTKVPYLILTQVKTLTNFSTQISEILEDVVATPALVGAEYLLQFIITDGTTTYAILPPTSSSGAYVVQNITSNPKMTNFRWVSNKTVVRANLQTRPTGVERWNMIPCSLRDLRFTLAYESPTRLSEFIGENSTTKDSTDAQLTAIYNLAHTEYLQRTRNGTTWQTMHSIAYSATGIEELFVQENFDRNLSVSSGYKHDEIYTLSSLPEPTESSPDLVEIPNDGIYMKVDDDPTVIDTRGYVESGTGTYYYYVWITDTITYKNEYGLRYANGDIQASTSDGYGEFIPIEINTKQSADYCICYALPKTFPYSDTKTMAICLAKYTTQKTGSDLHNKPQPAASAKIAIGNNYTVKLRRTGVATDIAVTTSISNNLIIATISNATLKALTYGDELSVIVNFDLGE